MAKEKKPRAENYEEKVKFDGSFEELMKMAVKTPAPKKEPKKEVK